MDYKQFAVDNARRQFQAPRFGDIPIRTDATLCDKDEIWMENPDGTAVKVWPPDEDPAYVAYLKGEQPDPRD